MTNSVEVDKINVMSERFEYEKTERNLDGFTCV